MKKAIFWLLMALGLPAGAESITEAEAKQQAWAFLQRQAQRRAKSAGDQPRRPVLTAVALPHSGASTAGTATTQGVRPLYVFNIDEGDGFVVIAGDDRLKPVLAYVDNGRFDAADLPPGTAWWLETARKQVELATREGILPEPVVTKAEGKAPKEMAPLVQTAWGQTAPYNNLCPLDPGTGARSVSGCVATTLAQILNYYGNPTTAHGTVSYTTTTLGIEIEADLSQYTFRYDQMLPVYGEGSGATAAQEAAVAELMYACGVAARMDYASYVSSAYAIPGWMLEHFDLDPAMGYEERIWHTATEWDALVRAELDAQRPVFYCGVSMEGGHAFICDGYNAEGLYHINWGWDGYCDGYFELATLNYLEEGNATPPHSMGSFGQGQQILTGLMPDAGGTKPEPRLTGLGGLTFDESRQPLGNVALTLHQVQAAYADFDGYLGYGFYDSANTLQAYSVCDRFELPTFYHVPELTLNGSFSTTDLPPGSYTVKAISSTDGTHFQPLITPVGNGKNNWLHADVEGTDVTFSAPADVAYALSIPADRVVLPDTIVGGNYVTLQFDVENTGAGRYNGGCYMLEYDGDYTPVGILELDIPAGGSQTVRYELYAPTMKQTLYYTLSYYNYEGAMEVMDLIEVPVKYYDLQGVQLTALTPTIAPGDSVKLRADLTNAGELAFDSKIYVKIMGEMSTGNTFTKYAPLQAAPGETKHTVLGRTLKKTSDPDYTAPAGTYTVELYDYESFDLLTQTTFEVGTQGTLRVNTTEGYDTACLVHAFRVPAGMRCGVVTGSADNVLAIDYRYAEGDVVPAKTPVVLQAPQGAYTYDIVTDCTDTAPTDNLLCGSTDGEGYCYAGEESYRYYMLSYNAAGENLAFYYGEADGAPFLNAPTRAFLALPLADAGYASYRLFEGTGTGIRPAGNAANGGQPVYSPDGRRLAQPFGQLPAGVYIRGGKKVVK